MLSLPPPHEWDVLWLRRLASLDCEQYRYYTTTLCRDVWLLHQQAIGAPPPERSSAAAPTAAGKQPHANTVRSGRGTSPRSSCMRGSDVACRYLLPIATG